MTSQQLAERLARVRRPSDLLLVTFFAGAPFLLFLLIVATTMIDPQSATDARANPTRALSFVSVGTLGLLASACTFWRWNVARILLGSIYVLVAVSAAATVLLYWFSVGLLAPLQGFMDFVNWGAGFDTSPEVSARVIRLATGFVVPFVLGCVAILMAIYFLDSKMRYYCKGVTLGELQKLLAGVADTAQQQLAADTRVGALWAVSNLSDASGAAADPLSIFGEEGSSSLIDGIIHASAEKDERIRAAACRALGTLTHNERVRSTLSTLAQSDPSPHIKKIAAQAMSNGEAPAQRLG